MPTEWSNLGFDQHTFESTLNMSKILVVLVERIAKNYNHVNDICGVCRAHS